ncbi:hypothetical protein BH10PLA2_BH10PLA2_14380 [soil metagenome]
MAEFFVIEGDVTAAPSDLLLLKYARDFYGADKLVAERLVASNRYKAKAMRPEPGDFVIVDSSGVIAPRQVMFLGTPELPAFNYDEMYVFARTALLNIKKLGLAVRDITTTVHGSNCGFDAETSLENLVRGFRDELARSKSSTVQSITFLTLESREFRKLNAKLLDIASEFE